MSLTVELGLKEAAGVDREMEREERERRESRPSFNLITAKLANFAAFTLDNVLRNSKMA